MAACAGTLAVLLENIFSVRIRARDPGQYTLVKQRHGDLFAFSVFLAMAAPTVLFAVLVSFFVLGLAPAVVFKFITPFSFFTLKTRLSDTPKQCYRCPQQLKPCGGAPPPVGLWPLPSPLPLM
jgi:hypothetical protein